MTPGEDSSIPSRRLDLAWDGETGVRIMINGNFLADSTKAARLRVQVVADAGRPMFGGSPSNKTIVINHQPTQPNKVGSCLPGFSCEGVHVAFHDVFGGLPTQLKSNEGILGDGDYKVRLYRDTSILVDSFAFTVNHANYRTTNGSFLDEAKDQIITFRLDSNLNRIGAPSVDLPHTRATTHLGAQIITPAPADTTIYLGRTLTVRGQATDGLPGTKRFAWDWNATGTNQETFDTEFTTSDVVYYKFPAAGDYKIRLVVRDGNDNPDVLPRGGHYAVSATKTVHVIPPGPDDAIPAGNSLASGTEVMCPSEVRLVYYAMKNIGTTTWSPSNYTLSLHHDSGWYPTSVPLSSSVAPNQTRTFNFNLYAPSYPGYYAAAYQMKKSAFFGDQNIGYAYVSDLSCGGAALDFSPSSGLEEDPTTWDKSGKQRDVLPLRLYVSPLDPQSAYLNYSYTASEANEVDLILRIEYDPTLLDPYATQQSTTIENLKVVTAAPMTGEYWIRVRGELPKGGGPLVRLPFRVLRDSPEQQWGTLTIFY